MRFKKLLITLSALCAVPVFAQTIGSVVSVNGVATVTTGTSGAAIAVGAPIVHGSRVITTSSGSVVLRTNSGCTVTVPPGHGLTVLSNLTCQQLQAAVQPVTTTTSTTTVTTARTVPVGPAFGGPGAVVGAWMLGLAAGIYVNENDDDDAPLSPR